MKTVIVIPARYASKRFDGKPLKPINGVSMLARTVRAAKLAGAKTGARILVATDDDRIDRCHPCGHSASPCSIP